jgi:hypothetical protein
MPECNKIYNVTGYAKFCVATDSNKTYSLHRKHMSHLFCPIYKLLILGELGGVIRSFLSGRDTREGGEPDNW